MARTSLVSILRYIGFPTVISLYEWKLCPKSTSLLNMEIWHCLIAHLFLSGGYIEGIKKGYCNNTEAWKKINMERMLIQYQKVFRLWYLWKLTDVTLQWCDNYEGSDWNQTKLKFNVILLILYTLYHTKAGNFKPVNSYNPNGKSRMENFLSFDI